MHDLRESRVQSNAVLEEAQGAETSQSLVTTGSMSTLESAALQTINQALVVWRAQTPSSSMPCSSINDNDARSERSMGSRTTNELNNIYNSNSYQSSASITPTRTVSESSGPRRKPVLSPGSAAGSSKTRNIPKIIAVCGMTGSGKSTFITRLVGRDIGVGHGLHSGNRFLP